MKKRGQAKVKKEARFKAFLSSAAWKRIRRDALDRAGHRCEQWLFGENEYTHWTTRCPATDKLTVHHKTYARFGGDEQPEDLVVLCKSCHDRHHALTPIGQSGLTHVGSIVPVVLADAQRAQKEAS